MFDFVIQFFVQCLVPGRTWVHLLCSWWQWDNEGQLYHHGQPDRTKKAQSAMHHSHQCRTSQWWDSCRHNQPRPEGGSYPHSLFTILLFYHQHASLHSLFIYFSMYFLRKSLCGFLPVFLVLQVWVGSVTEITTNELSAEDSDTPPEGLEFIVTPPSNGHLALKSAPSRHILNFTQTHIQSKQLVFVHNGIHMVVSVSMGSL